MTKDARRRADAEGPESQNASGRKGAAGTWMVPVALSVCLAMLLGWEIAGGALRLPVKPVRELEESMLSGSNGEYRLDINLATATELGHLEGIGEKLALRIVEWRDANGPFESAEQLMEVEGIGEGKFEAIRDMITVGE